MDGGNKKDLQKEEQIALERRILGTVIGTLDAQARTALLQKLKPSFFVERKHRILLEALQSAKDTSLEGLVAHLHTKELSTVVGGIAYVASLMDEKFYGDVNIVIDGITPTLEERTLRHELLRHHKRLEQSLGEGIDPLEAFNELRAAIQTSFAPAGGSALLGASQTVSELMAHPPERPLSILGEGLVTKGSLALLSAIPGIGKTWLGLQLACAWTAGQPWLDFVTRPCRVGYISLELPLFYLYERLNTINRQCGEEDTPHWNPELLHLVAPPLIPYLPELPSPSHVQDLIGFIQSKQLDVLILDPLSRCHRLDENSAQDMGHVLGAMDQIRLTTGASILLIHHEPKGDPAQKRKREDIDAPRGSSRFASDPQLIMRVIKLPSGTLQLRFGKVTFGPKPKEILLDTTPDGTFFVVDEDPRTANALGEKEENDIALNDLLAERYISIPLDTVRQALPYERSLRTVQRMLRDAGWIPQKDTEGRLWVRDPSDQQQELEDQDAQD
jgi:hypothetical protein